MVPAMLRRIIKPTYNAIVYVDIVSVYVTSDSVHGSNVRSVTNGKQMVTTPTVWWTSVQ